MTTAFKTKGLCLVLALGLLSACAQDGTITKKDVGMVVGGAAGGAAGSAIWAGNPAAQTLGTIMGVIVGAAVGGYVGARLDDYDRQQMAYALENNRDNARAQWRNPNSNQNYSMAPTRTYYEPGGTPCREFTQTIYIDGKPETAKGTACRQPDGVWRVNTMQ